MTGQLHYAFRRSCETADMLQLSRSWYRSWIVNSTVCSVLACAWACVATLSFLVWNRCLPYRWFQCFHKPIDVLDSSQHADSKRNSCFSGALWFCDRESFPFFRCTPHSLQLISYTTSDLSSVFLTLYLNGNSSPIVFGAFGECYIKINLWIVDFDELLKSYSEIFSVPAHEREHDEPFFRFNLLSRRFTHFSDVLLDTYRLISDSTTVFGNSFCSKVRLSCSFSAALSFSVLQIFQIRSNRHLIRLALYFNWP